MTRAPGLDANQFRCHVDRRRVRLGGRYHVPIYVALDVHRVGEGGDDAVDVAVGNGRLVDDQHGRARPTFGGEVGDRLGTGAADDHPRHPAALVRCHAPVLHLRYTRTGNGG